MMSEPLLSILICTTVNRRELFTTLYGELLRQSSGLPVEVLYEEDDKIISVGAKSQKLLERAQGEYVCRFDSDDWPCGYYVIEILTALQSKPDCVGILIHMTTNGRHPQVCCHSLRFKVWGKRRAGYDYVRNVTQFNPVRRDLALQTGFKDIRHGEDKDYADRLTRLCKTEVFINRKLFHYRYSTAESHNEKYGIK